MKKSTWYLILISFVIVTIAIAAQTDWSNGDTGLVVRTAIQANDTELYGLPTGSQSWTPTGIWDLLGLASLAMGPNNYTASVDPPDEEGLYHYQSGIAGFDASMLTHYSNGAVQYPVESPELPTVTGEYYAYNSVTNIMEVVSAGSLSIAEQAGDPAFSGMSTGDLIVATGSGDMFYKSATGGYTIPGTYTIDPVIPTLLSWTIQTNGTDSILVFSEAMTFDTGGSGGFATDTPTETLTYGSGDTTTTVTFTHPVINSTVTDNPLGDFIQPTDGWQSASSSTELASFQDAAVVNQSTQTPSVILANHFENLDITLGTPAGSTTGTDEIMAEIGTPDLSTFWTSDGTYSGHFDADGEYYQLDNPTDHDDIKITWDMRVISLPTSGEQGIISIELDNTEYVAITYNTTGDHSVRVSREGSNVSTTVQVYTDIVAGATISCEYQTKVAVAGLDTYLNIGGNVDEDDDDPTAKTSSCSAQVFGHGGILATGSGGEIYIDNVQISVSDRY